MSSQSTNVAAAQNQGSGNGITVSDSGTTIDDSTNHIDFGASLSASESSEDTVEIQEKTNPYTVNVRTDLGVQPEQDDLWGAIKDHYTSRPPTERNHRYEIPAGTWYVETDNIHFDAHEFLSIVGDPYATLKVTDQDVDRLMTVGRIDDSLPHAQSTVMKNLEVDIRGDYDAGICRWYTYTYGLIQNVSMRGRRDRRNPNFGGDRHTIMVDGRRVTTTNIIRGCHLNNGDTHYDRDTHVGHAIPFSSEIYNRGTNIWDGCQVSGYVDNGFYVSNNSGRNILRGCHARDCSGAGFRIGANDYIEDCRITMTEQPGYPWSGLWLQSGGGQMVKGLTIRNEVEKNTEIIRLTQDGPAHLTDVHITDKGGDGRAIRVADNDEAQTVFEGCTITDHSSPSISDYAVYISSSNVVFRDCEYDLNSQTEQDRHGFFVSRRGTNVDQLRMHNTQIEPDGASLRFGESGRAHNIESSNFDGLVMSDPGTTLEDVLWVGNRHRGTTAFRGERSQWQGDFNFGFDI
ncbi:right-handed parallel beta-helix repeat-containing protein [Natrinema sp. DC36]|uniref:right-handed parallel beta-helix repeat-containing protein n=1 Tax=Natrinema sp. DC36 TaxID=2878680 RepID=UPI001CF0266F|nr:right-handed parallel beta-helix repeat-containing protein [Natrinema sp. DC36]